MVLVTGGTGFIGSYIIKNLIEKGLSVRAIRRSSELPFYIPQEIFKTVEWIQADVLDLVALDDAMAGVDAVIHSAAVVSFSRSNRQTMYQVNVEGTANVVNTALERGVRRLVHVSSVAALGRTRKEELVTEEKKWQENKSNTHYAISKYHAEMHAWRGFAEGLKGVVVNPSTVLGFGNWHQSSCAIFRNAYKGFRWYTKGINGFVGVEDVAEAAVRLLLSDISQKRFIINAENITFQHLFNTIADHFQKRRPQQEASRMMGEIAWRLEAVKALLTGKKALLTRETARVAQSRTSFDGNALLRALPGFQYTTLDTVIKNACEKYRKALAEGALTL